MWHFFNYLLMQGANPSYCWINAPGEQAVFLSILFNYYWASRVIGLDIIMTCTIVFIEQGAVHRQKRSIITSICAYVCSPLVVWIRVCTLFWKSFNIYSCSQIKRLRHLRELNWFINWVLVLVRKVWWFCFTVSSVWNTEETGNMYILKGLEPGPQCLEVFGKVPSRNLTIFTV